LKPFRLAAIGGAASTPRPGRATILRRRFAAIRHVWPRGLMRLTDIVAGEQVAVWNLNNGQRVETYAIALPEGSGQIVVNGAAAHHFTPGDRVIIVAFCLTDEVVNPRMIVVDPQNKYVRDLANAEA
jgi:aspartate 1-decarboxylase